jgi:2-phosphoglycerate kinase
MPKLTVIRQPENESSPFLRGILVQSLVQAGLPFDEAFELAQELRDELQGKRQTTNVELRARVGELLGERYGNRQREQYERGDKAEPDLIVHTRTRDAPFSVGILANSLETCAISPEIALVGARMVLENMRSKGFREVDHLTLRKIIYKCLRKHCSQQVADRYLSWRQFENSDMPLIVLIGGTSGIGKGTVSSDLAYRLNITHHQSTGLMREIIRNYLSPQMVPSLAYSSFEAWQGVPSSIDGGQEETKSSVIAGFQAQFAAMKPAMESTINSAVGEGHDLILEGTHVLPAAMDIEVKRDEAVVVPLMLATMKKGMLRAQLKRRLPEGNKQQTAHNLDNFDNIWKLQSWLLKEADQDGIPIIENLQVADTVRAVLDHVVEQVMKAFPPQAGERVWEV